MQASFDISISIALYNKVAFTEACVESIMRLAGDKSYELIFFDNASTDKTTDYIRSLDCAFVQYYRSPVNLGFGLAHNYNLTRARGTYFLALNNDLVIEETNFLWKLMAEFEKNSRLAILGFKGGYSKLLPSGLTEKSDVDLDYVEGSALMLPTGLANKYGLFPNDYLLFYSEDIDLSLRYRQLGYEIATISVNHQHESGVSASMFHPKFKDFCAIKNRAQLVARWQTFLMRGTFSAGDHLADTHRKWPVNLVLPPPLQSSMVAQVDNLMQFAQFLVEAFVAMEAEKNLNSQRVKILEKELQDVLSSKSYGLGRLLLWPLRQLKVWWGGAN